MFGETPKGIIYSIHLIVNASRIYFLITETMFWILYIFFMHPILS